MKRCEGALEMIDVNRCAYRAVNFNKPDEPTEECDDPASVQVGWRWYCPRHGEVMRQPDIFATEAKRPDEVA